MTAAVAGLVVRPPIDWGIRAISYAISRPQAVSIRAGVQRGGAAPTTTNHQFPLVQNGRVESGQVERPPLKRLIDEAIEGGSTHTPFPPEVANRFGDYRLLAEYFEELMLLLEAGKEVGILFALQTKDAMEIWTEWTEIGRRWPMAPPQRSGSYQTYLGQT